MAITAAETEAEITSDLHNEIVAALNGTVSPTGVGSPMKFVQHNDAASYGVTSGNIDATAGLIHKFQYGPVAGPTTVATIDKTGYHAASSGIVLEALSQAKSAMVFGGVADPRTPTRMTLTEGTMSAPIDTESEMLNVTRYWTHTGTSSLLEIPGVLMSFQLPASAIGTQLGGAGMTFNGLWVRGSSFGTTSHALLGQRTDVFGSNLANIWGQIILATSQNGLGCQVLELDADNASGTTRTALAVQTAQSIDTGTTFSAALNVLGYAHVKENPASPGTYLDSLYNHAGLFIQALPATVSNGKTADGRFHHGILFNYASVAPNGVGIDMRSLTAAGSSGIKHFALPNLGGIYGRTTGGTDVAMLFMDSSDRTMVANDTGVVLQNVGGTRPYLLANSAGITVGGALNGQTFGTYHLEELKTLGSGSATHTTTIQIPAGAIVKAVSTRVLVQPGNTTTYDVGVSGATTRYTTAASTVATTTSLGTGADGAAPRTYTAAVAITITTNAVTNNALGQIRVTIWYDLPGAALS